ncbi:MAG TPA: hypothetical protein VNI54_03165 [Thermoanaerobaculia bacterium]|nr:hypothetical protein [Thermoanaerobaculia bacterium]
MRRIALLLLLACNAVAEQKSVTIYVSPQHPYSLAYNPDIWTSSGSDDEGTDLVLQHRSGKADATLYVYAGNATLDALRASALENGKKTAPDLRVVSEERIKKNGADILTMHLTGESAEGPVAYRAVYWAGSGKYVQLVATTTTETDDDVQQLLNGLRIRSAKDDGRAFTVDFPPLKWEVKDDGARTGGMLFAHNAGDTMALASASRTDIPASGLRHFIIDQSRALAKNAKVVGEEPKTVAGTKVTMMQLEGTARDGESVVILGYFFRGAGTYVQSVTFTARERFAERKADMIEFLDGLRIHLPQ